MKPKPPPARRIPPAIRFREQIETAASGGLDRGDMTLRLTLGDVTLLKRDRTLEIADISFAGGVMRFLGVTVEQGGVAESLLVTRPEPGSDASP
jgi:hypothetical protein